MQRNCLKEKNISVQVACWLLAYRNMSTSLILKEDNILVNLYNLILQPISFHICWLLLTFYCLNALHFILARE